MAEDEDSGAALAQAQEDDVLDQNAELNRLPLNWRALISPIPKRWKRNSAKRNHWPTRNSWKRLWTSPSSAMPNSRKRLAKWTMRPGKWSGILRLEVAQLGESLGEKPAGGQCRLAAGAGSMPKKWSAWARAPKRGLMGLQMVCGMIRANVLAFSQGAQWSAAQHKLLGDWPATVVNYLQAPSVRDAYRAGELFARRAGRSRWQ
ncbi:MAG: hypothetical protein U1F68_15205 [Gammaproteobacteria bacterium]